jgi:hypothetical protein
LGGPGEAYAVDESVISRRQEIRALFGQQLGADRYRKFVQQFVDTAKRDGSLLYWQQREWTRFCEVHGLAALPFDQLVSLFSVCHVHLTELEPRAVPIRKGVWCVTYSPAEAERRAAQAPYGSEFVLDSAAWGDASSVTVDWCPKCASAR